MSYERYIHLRNNLNIDEILHYYKVGGSERALKFYYTFFYDTIKWEDENKIIRSLKTNNIALLENTLYDIKKKTKKELIEYLKRD